MSKYTYQYFLRRKIFENSSNLESFLDANQFILYFKLKDEYFAAGEDSRMVFAQLKKPDEETPEGWVEQADFSAYNLSKLVEGDPEPVRLFGNDDLKQIKIVDKQEILDKFDGKFKPKKPVITFGDVDTSVNVDEH